jgi:hypothetical protein
LPLKACPSAEPCTCMACLVIVCCGLLDVYGARRHGSGAKNGVDMRLSTQGCSSDSLYGSKLGSWKFFTVSQHCGLDYCDRIMLQEARTISSMDWMLFPKVESLALRPRRLVQKSINFTHAIIPSSDSVSHSSRQQVVPPHREPDRVYVLQSSSSLCPASHPHTHPSSPPASNPPPQFSSRHTLL